jgi:rhodanese-related sulfurtransferase
MDGEITPLEVKARLDRAERLTLLDVREPWECAAAIIAGAKQIPMGEVPIRACAELDRAEPIVVYCHHGVRSLTVTNWLRRQGFDKVHSMQGGIDAWSRQVDGNIPLY